jgi:alkylation response protein AidB-like acyl-CoA dehydrogenase
MSVSAKHIERLDVSELDGKRDLIELCKNLGEGFAPRAAEYDREGRFPVENFDELKAAGLLGIMVPTEFGGYGADFLTYTKALEQLAKGDAATALTFNMHNITVGSLAEFNVDGMTDERCKVMIDFRNWVFNQAVEGKKIFASASSEPGVGAHFSKLKTTYQRVDGGFVVNGVKSFVSMAGYADHYVVAARAAESKSDIPAISFLIVSKDASGIRFEDTWDVLGMRATATNPMHLEDCFVAKDSLYLGSEGTALYKIAREPHWLVGGYVGVYLGICSATFEFLTEFLKKKKQPGSDVPMSDDPLVQQRVGELYVALESARLVAYHAAKLVDTARGTPEANAAIHHAKYVVSELGPWLTSHAIRLSGATGLSRKLPLERLYRDSRCGGLMPATSDECLQYLGKTSFGTELRNPLETYW